MDWTNPWGGHKYIDDIEAREDGGTPAFLQTIKAAMAISLKEDMGPERILSREHQQLKDLWDMIHPLPNLHILAQQHRETLQPWVERLGLPVLFSAGTHPYQSVLAPARHTPAALTAGDGLVVSIAARAAPAPGGRAPARRPRTPAGPVA